MLVVALAVNLSNTFQKRIFTPTKYLDPSHENRYRLKAFNCFCKKAPSMFNRAP